MMPDLKSRVPENGLLDPSAIAESYFQLHLQHPSAWTQEADSGPGLREVLTSATSG